MARSSTSRRTLPWVAAFASHYAACKSALSGFVKSWARELAPWNIAVNAVAPGIIETDMTLNSIGKERITAWPKTFPWVG